MPNLASARAQRVRAYVDRLTTALGHQDRHGPLRDYVTGLCLPGDRKSIEPMAARGRSAPRAGPPSVDASLHRERQLGRCGPSCAWPERQSSRPWSATARAAAWVVGDAAIPKKGTHSVGVARQYCGVLGKPENFQVAVSVSVAHAREYPVAYRLYLPEVWARDRGGRRAADVADTMAFRVKSQIALEQIAQLTREGVPAAPVVANAGYGVVTAFRLLDPTIYSISVVPTPGGRTPRFSRADQQAQPVLVGDRRP